LRVYPVESFRQFIKLKCARLASREDIFLFKAVTERETDLSDMRVLAESGLNWEIIKRECQKQSLSTGILWENALYQKLLDLKSKYGIKSPLEKQLKKIAEEKMAEIAILEEIKKGNTTVKTISRSLKLSELFIRQSLEKMEKKGLIKVDKSTRPYKLTLK
jgi:predicted transcriptional regulator